MSSLNSSFMPTVLDNTQRGERVWDVPSRLFNDRIILLCSEINRQVAASITGQILVLHHQNPKGEIQIIVNSPGGEVVAGLAIYDMMQWTSCPIQTVCTGEACSAASLILAGGSKGKRSILPNSRVLLHQPWGGVKGQVTDIKIQYEEMQRMKDETLDILQKHTGQNRDTLAADLERDYILDAKRAIEYGVVDEVLAKPS